MMKELQLPRGDRHRAATLLSGHFQPTTRETCSRRQGTLLPEQLAAKAADAVRELRAEAAAANTTRSYATALRDWAGW